MDLTSHGIVALVRQHDKYLLLEDSREPMRGYWAPPHGRCGAEDNTEEAGVVREVKEETGLTVFPVRKVLTQPADTKIKTVSFWIVTADMKAREVVLNEESSAFKWCSLDEALDLLLYPGTKDFFEKVKAGIVNLEFTHLSAIEVSASTERLT